MNNTKREKFKKLAEKRVTDALLKLHSIGNLSNKVNYEYTDDEVAQILDTLRLEIEILEEKFKEGDTSSIQFKFKK